MWTMPARVAEHPMYHLPGSRVWFEDSPQGIARAAGVRNPDGSQHYASTDLNLTWQRPDPDCVICTPSATAPTGWRARLKRRLRRLRVRFGGGPCKGHLWVNHWPRPLRHGWVDPAGKIRRWKPLRDMSTEEILRLHVSGHSGFRMRLIDEMVPLLRVHGLHGSLEPKGRYGWTVARMRHLMDLCTRERVPALVKSAYSRPLRAARAVGFQTRYTRDHRRGM